VRKKILVFVALFGFLLIAKSAMGLSSVKEIVMKSDSQGNVYIKYQTVSYPIPDVRAFDGKDSVKIIHNDKSGCLIKGKPNSEFKIRFITN